MTTTLALVTCLASLAPLSQQAGKFFSPEPSAGGYFGTVALARDWIVVGSPTNKIFSPGVVYVFDRVSGRRAAKLTQGRFSGWPTPGAAIDVDGDLVVVGLPSANFSTGTVSVFDARTGEELHCLDSSGQLNGALYGQAVAIEGDLVAVGAPSNWILPEHEGSVHLFSAASGDELARLGSPAPPTAGVPEHHFGLSLDLDAGRVLVGSRGVGFVGAAYLFDAASGNLLTEFHPPPSSVPGAFGALVALRGDKVAISDPYADSERGAVYLFDASSGALLHSLRFEPSQEGEFFGISLAMNDDLVAVGAPHSTVDTWRGAVHLFDVHSGARAGTLSGSSPPIAQHFGASLAIDSGSLLVGDPRDNQAAYFAGAAYLFDL